MKARLVAVAAVAVALAAPVAGQSFDPTPWIADLEQARQAFHEKYANLEWLENERGLQIDPLFDRAGKQLAGASSEADVRGLFDRIEQRIGDGHV
jgi:hypothetical protein